MSEGTEQHRAWGCPHLDGYNPVSPEHVADPEGVWRTLRRDTPVFFSPVQNAFVVTRYEDACQIYADPSTFSSAGSLVPVRPNPPEVDAILAQGYPQEELGAMIMVDEPRHSELRRPLNDWFSPKRVMVFEPDIRKLAGELIDAFPAGRVEVVSAFAYPLVLGVMLGILGIPRQDGPRIRAWVEQRVALIWGDLALEEHLVAARAFIEFQRYLQALLDERRREPRDDLISDFVRQGGQESRPLSDSETIGQMIGFLSAGHEMTTSAITFGLFNLLRVPSRWDALRTDPELMAGVIEETVRFQGPSLSVWRVATREVEVGGLSIPVGARISVLNSSANRDDVAFEAPEEFDPTKVRSNPHLGFGRGIHFCLGASLARLEMRLAFEELGRHIPSLRLPEGEGVELVPNVTLRLPRTLHLEWDPGGDALAS